MVWFGLKSRESEVEMELEKLIEAGPTERFLFTLVDLVEARSDDRSPPRTLWSHLQFDNDQYTQTVTAFVPAEAIDASDSCRSR